MTTIESNYLEAIKKAYTAYLKSTRSSKKVEPLHGFVAHTLDAKLRSAYPDTTFKVISKGFGENREAKVSGLLLDKDCDITIFRDDKPVAVVMVKFVCSNYAQNANNYLESQTGENFNLRSKGIAVHHLIVLPVYVPYFEKSGVVADIEYITDFKLDKYRILAEAAATAPEQAALPSSMLLTMLDTNNLDSLKSLRSAETVDARSTENFADVDKFSLTTQSYSKKAEDSTFSEKNLEFLNSVNSVEKFLDALVAGIMGEKTAELGTL